MNLRRKCLEADQFQDLSVVFARDAHCIHFWFLIKPFLQKITKIVLIFISIIIGESYLLFFPCKLAYIEVSLFNFLVQPVLLLIWNVYIQQIKDIHIFHWIFFSETLCSEDKYCVLDIS